MFLGELIDNALPSVQPPPAPLKTTLPERAVPFVVTVLPVVVALNVIAPVALQTVPAISDIDPLIVTPVGVPAKVTVPADTVKSRQGIVALPKVTV
jgi:hypothetical protein